MKKIVLGVMFLSSGILIISCSSSQKVLKASMAQADTIAVITGEELDAEKKDLYIKGVRYGSNLSKVVTYKEAPKTAYPEEYDKIYPEVVKYLQAKFPNKKIELVSRKDLPVKDGEIVWTETEYSMYYVLKFSAKYVAFYNVDQPVREKGTEDKCFFEFHSKLMMYIYGKDEKGEFEMISTSMIPGSGLSLSSIGKIDPDRMNRQFKNSYVAQNQKAMLDSLIGYPPFDPVSIVDPTIANVKKNIDKFSVKVSE